MRAQRLFSIIMLLQGTDQLTTHQLADQLGVSERTIHRDMETLSISGIPIYAERGRAGGWKMLDTYRANLGNLNLSEVQALLLGNSPKVLDDLGFQKKAQLAVLKLIGTLPSMAQARVKRFQERIYIDSSSWHQNHHDASQHLNAIQEAVWNDKQITISYQRSDASVVDRTVHPLGLVIKGTTWYLIAHIESQIRTYRISRVLDVQIMDDSIIRPDDFDLEQYWQESTRHFVSTLRQYDFTVAIPPQLQERIQYFSSHFVSISHQTEDDSIYEKGCILELQADEEDEAARFVVGFGDEMTVIAPDSLKQAVIARAKSTLSVYR